VANSSTADPSDPTSPKALAAVTRARTPVRKLQVHSRHSRQLFVHYWLPVLLMLVLIKMESTEAWSGEQTGHLLARLTEWLGISLSSAGMAALNLTLRKCGHLIGYGVLSLTVFLLLRGTYWFQHEYQLALKGGVAIRRMWWRIEWAAVAVFCTFLVAVADETHQMSLASRTGRWYDVGLDTAAAILAVTLVYLRARRRCRMDRKS
jgi:VanZ family protein